MKKVRVWTAPEVIGNDTNIKSSGCFDMMIINQGDVDANLWGNVAINVGDPAVSLGQIQPVMGDYIFEREDDIPLTFGSGAGTKKIVVLRTYIKC